MSVDARQRSDAIPALTGAPEQIRLAARMRAGHITTMLDMQADLTGHDAVSSAISELLHIALRQSQAAWWLKHAPDRHTSMLLSELAERLCGGWPDGWDDAVCVAERGAPP